VPHQANKRIIKAAADRLDMAEQKIVCNLDEFGNTSAASIPLALAQSILKGQIKGPATCCLVGFGGGLTWGAAIIRWTAVDRRPNPRSVSSIQLSNKQT
jgi:3-oxoacyl-[acyl-carrier-protein] synthase III